MQIDLNQIDAIIDRWDGEQEALLSIFQDVQEVYRYLPKEAIQRVTERLGLPLTRGFAVATFYRSLSLTPRGEHEIHVCLGTACHLRGGPRLVDTFERELSVSCGHTTQDGRFTLETVNCLGTCAIAPVIVVDKTYHSEVTPDKVTKIIKSYQQNNEVRSENQ